MIGKNIREAYDKVYLIEELGINFFHLDRFYPEIVKLFIDFLNKIYRSNIAWYDWVSFVGNISAIRDYYIGQNRSPDFINGLATLSGSSTIPKWRSAMDNALGKLLTFEN